MHVIYESTDAMIEYGLLNSESRPWISEYNSNQPAGNSGPANSAAEELDVGRDWTRTHTRDAFARVDFFGTSCRIQGWTAGANVSVDFDGQPFVFNPPTDPNDTFMILRDLPIGWHALRIVATAFQTEGVSNLSITRVVVDTGLPDGYRLESTFDAHADGWTTDEGWERRMTGNTPSRRTDRSGASAKFATNLTEASVVFLYGIASPDYSGFAVGWVEPGSGIIGEPMSIRRVQRNISVENVLLYMGVVPKGGARGIFLQQADGQPTGEDGTFPKLEFTRLEVYASPNGRGFFDSLSVPAPQPTTSMDSPTPSTDVQRTSSPRGSHISPATIAAIVSVTSVVILCGALAVLLYRRRRNRSLRIITADMSSDMEEIHSLPPSAVPFPFEETTGGMATTQGHRKKSHGVPRRDQTLIRASSLAAPDLRPLGGWAASSHDPEVQSVLSASTQPFALAADVGVRDSVALISESHPPAYEMTQIQH